MSLLGKLICAVTRKHKRGKRINDVTDADKLVIYQCPRCGSRWTRKVKAHALS